MTAMSEKNLYLVRGLPGSGKTALVGNVKQRRFDASL